MRNLYFVRHGESTANSLRICAGHTDVLLSEKGMEEARTAGRELAESGTKIDLIVSSPLKRAYVTAEIVAAEIDYPKDKILVEEGAIERYRGDLEGKSSDLQDSFIDAQYIEHGAESEADMLTRAERLINGLKDCPEENILIVSHNQFGRTLVAYTKGINRDDVEILPNAHVFPLINARHV